jgi:hypothetical protein
MKSGISKMTDTDKKDAFPDVNRMKKILIDRLETMKDVNDEKKKVFMHNVGEATKEYYDNLLQNIYNATDYMENSNNTNGCVYVNVPTNRIKWGDQDDKYIPWHWIHYGFPDRKRKSWWDRDTKFWGSSEMVFRRLQRLCREHNYYLYDLSDPEKGSKTFLKISIERVEEFDSKDLWHGFNKQLDC